MKPDADASPGEPQASLAAGESVGHAQRSWDAMLDEVQRAIELKRGEQALQIPEAGSGTLNCQLPSGTVNRSVYSLLLEPALFKFPS